MASFNTFYLFSDDLLKGVFDFSSDAFNVMLTNVAPVATNHVFADLAEITAQNGYTAGGKVSAITLSNLAGLETVTATDVTFTAVGGSFGPFRYAVFYDTTPISPLKPLLCWFDYGSSISLNIGESFTVEPNSGSPTGTLFTLRLA